MDVDVDADLDAWQQVETDNGEMYWYNAETLETTWIDPYKTLDLRGVADDNSDSDSDSYEDVDISGDIEMAENPMRGSSSEWEEVAPANGDKYYFNRTTGQTQWSPPTGFVASDVTKGDSHQRFVDFDEYLEQKRPKVLIGLVCFGLLGLIIGLIMYALPCDDIIVPFTTEMCINPITGAETEKTNQSCPVYETCTVCEITASPGKYISVDPSTEVCSFRSGLVKKEISPPCPAIEWCIHPLTGVKSFNTQAPNACPSVQLCDVCQENNDPLTNSAPHPTNKSCPTNFRLAKASAPCPEVFYCVDPVDKSKTLNWPKAVCPPIHICKLCKNTATGDLSAFVEPCPLGSALDITKPVNGNCPTIGDSTDFDGLLLLDFSSSLLSDITVPYTNFFTDEVDVASNTIIQKFRDKIGGNSGFQMGCTAWGSDIIDKNDAASLSGGVNPLPLTTGVAAMQTTVQGWRLVEPVGTTKFAPPLSWCANQILDNGSAETNAYRTCLLITDGLNSDDSYMETCSSTECTTFCNRAVVKARMASSETCNSMVIARIMKVNLNIKIVGIYVNVAGTSASSADRYQAKLYCYTSCYPTPSGDQYLPSCQSSAESDATPPIDKSQCQYFMEGEFSKRSELSNKLDTLITGISTAVQGTSVSAAAGNEASPTTTTATQPTSTSSTSTSSKANSTTYASKSDRKVGTKVEGCKDPDYFWLVLFFIPLILYLLYYPCRDYIDKRRDLLAVRIQKKIDEQKEERERKKREAESLRIQQENLKMEIAKQKEMERQKLEREDFQRQERADLMERERIKAWQEEIEREAKLNMEQELAEFEEMKLLTLAEMQRRREAKDFNDTQEDLRDGVKLLESLNDISPGCVDFSLVNKKCKNKFQRIENCNLVIRVAKEEGYDVNNIGGIDIEGNNRKLVSALVWQMIRRMLDSMLDGGGNIGFGANAEIIDWANSMVEYRHECLLDSGTPHALIQVSGFGDPKMANGRFLMELIDTVVPGCIAWQTVENFKTKNGEINVDGLIDNAQQIIDVMKEIGCILVFFDIEDVLCVDEMWIVSLLGSIMHFCKSQPDIPGYDEYLETNAALPLPKGWSMEEDGDRKYFMCLETDQTLWERPIPIKQAKKVRKGGSKKAIRQNKKSLRLQQKQLQKNPPALPPRKEFASDSPPALPPRKGPAKKVAPALPPRTNSREAERRRTRMSVLSTSSSLRSTDDEKRESMWYYIDGDGETQGPHPASHMSYWRSGIDEPFITDDMRVCLEGENNWRVVSDVKSFE